MSISWAPTHHPQPSSSLCPAPSLGFPQLRGWVTSRAAVSASPDPAVLRGPAPHPTHADQARGKSGQRDVSLGGLGVRAAIAKAADACQAVAVGAKRHGRDQGHGAHGQREASVEAPHLVGRQTGPEGSGQARGPARKRATLGGPGRVGRVSALPWPP